MVKFGSEPTKINVILNVMNHHIDNEHPKLINGYMPINIIYHELLRRDYKIKLRNLGMFMYYSMNYKHVQKKKVGKQSIIYYKPLQ